MNHIEEQILNMRLATEEYMRRKEELDQWLMEQLHTASVRLGDIHSLEALKLLCSHFGVELTDLRSPSRRRDLVDYRFIFAYALRHSLKTTYPRIGQLMNKDHSTIMSGVQQVVKMLEIRHTYEVQLGILSEAMEIVEAAKK